jgi:hypothetical protein
VAKLRHPNVIAIHTVDKVGEMVFFAMDLHERGVGEMVESGRPLDQGTVLRIGLDVASALEFAHAKGVTHRDLKPANLRIDLHGNGIVTDFGIAEVASHYEEATGTSVYIGTPRYMSPEQARGRRVDHRSDLYSLGVTLYHMATGSPPFEGSDWYDLGRKHIEEAPRSPREAVPSLDPKLEAVILRCLEKEPEKRFQSAGEVITALHAAGNGAGAGSAVQGTVVRSRGMMPRKLPAARTFPFRDALRRRRKPLLASGMAALVALTALLAGLRLFGHRTSARLYPVNPAGFYSERAIADGSGVAGEVALNFNATLDPKTVSGEAARILGPAASPVPAEVSVSNGTTLRIHPTRALLFNTPYAVEVTPAVRGRGREVLFRSRDAKERGVRLEFRTGDRPANLGRRDGVAEKPPPVLKPARLSVAADLPKDAIAVVVVNHRELGPAPQSISVQPGVANHVVLYGTKAGSGFRAKLLEENVTVDSGQELEFRRKVPPFGSIIVASSPPGRVFIDGVDTEEETPLAGYILKSGQHTLVIKPASDPGGQYRDVLEKFVLPAWTWGYKLGPYSLATGAPAK